MNVAEHNLRNIHTSMNMPPNTHIVFIVEGGAETGMGHVVRSLALAERLTRYAPVTFVTQSAEIIRRKIALCRFPILSCNNYTTSLEQIAPTIVIIDKPDVQESLAEFIQYDLGARLCIFGNVSAANQHAHVVVNAVIGAEKQNIRRQDTITGTTYLEGPSYVVLRKEFYQQQGLYRYNPELSSVLLLFGGADPANLTCRTLRVLLDSSNIDRITVCLGAVCPNEDEVRQILANRFVRTSIVNILHDMDSVAWMMLKHDIVLTSFGVTLLEAFSLEVPAVAFFQNDLQRFMSAGFPMTYEYDQIPDLSTLIQQKHEAYSNYLDLIRPLRVGTGVDEIIDLIIH